MRGFVCHCVLVGTFIPPEGVFCVRLLRISEVLAAATCPHARQRPPCLKLCQNHPGCFLRASLANKRVVGGGKPTSGSTLAGPLPRPTCRTQRLAWQRHLCTPCAEPWQSSLQLSARALTCRWLRHAMMRDLIARRNLPSRAAAATMSEALSKSPIARNKVSYRFGNGMPCQCARGS